jgi:hypothetical protein
MRKRVILCAILLCALSGGALVVISSGYNKTSYQGKSLSKWVSIYSIATWHPGYHGLGPAEREQAADAIGHIGTNALPLLLALIDAPPRGLWRRGGDLSARLPDWIRFNMPADWLRRHHPVVLRPDDAGPLSQALGPAAAPVIPALLQRLSSTNWTGHRDVALCALGCTGPEALAKSAVPLIPMLLTNFNPQARMNATNALHAISLSVPAT